MPEEKIIYIAVITSEWMNRKNLNIADSNSIIDRLKTIADEYGCVNVTGGLEDGVPVIIYEFPDTKNAYHATHDMLQIITYLYRMTKTEIEERFQLKRSPTPIVLASQTPMADDTDPKRTPIQTLTRTVDTTRDHNRTAELMREAATTVVNAVYFPATDDNQDTQDIYSTLSTIQCGGIASPGDVKNIIQYLADMIEE